MSVPFVPFLAEGSRAGLWREPNLPSVLPGPLPLSSHPIPASPAKASPCAHPFSPSILASQISLCSLFSGFLSHSPFPPAEFHCPFGPRSPNWNRPAPLLLPAWE